MDGDKPYVTDNDNYIVDLYFTEPIKDAKKAGEEIAQVRGRRLPAAQEWVLRVLELWWWPRPTLSTSLVFEGVVASPYPLHLLRGPHPTLSGCCVGGATGGGRGGARPLPGHDHGRHHRRQGRHQRAGQVKRRNIPVRIRYGVPSNGPERHSPVLVSCCDVVGGAVGCRGTALGFVCRGQPW